MTDTTSCEQKKSFVNDPTTPKLFIASRRSGKTYALLEIAKETGATFIGPTEQMTKNVKDMDNYSRNINLHSSRYPKRIRRDTVVIDEIFVMANRQSDNLQRIITNNTVIAAAGTPQTFPIHPLIQRTFRSIYMSGVYESKIIDRFKNIVRDSVPEVFVRRTIDGYDVLLSVGGNKEIAIASDGSRLYTSTKDNALLAAAESIAHLKREC